MVTFWFIFSCTSQKVCEVCLSVWRNLGDIWNALWLHGQKVKKIFLCGYEKENTNGIHSSDKHIWLSWMKQKEPPPGGSSSLFPKKWFWTRIYFHFLPQTINWHSSTRQFTSTHINCVEDLLNKGTTKPSLSIIESDKCRRSLVFKAFSLKS